MKHKIYVAALSSVGVDTVLSHFHPRKENCRYCGKSHKKYEEKKTDVISV